MLTIDNMNKRIEELQKKMFTKKEIAQQLFEEGYDEDDIELFLWDETKDLRRDMEVDFGL